MTESAPIGSGVVLLQNLIRLIRMLILWFTCNKFNWIIGINELRARNARTRAREGHSDLTVISQEKGVQQI